MTSLQQAKYNAVIENVKPLFLSKGVNTLKISDIAKLLGIGEATIYRYFGSKTNLVIEVGISLWEDVYNELSSLDGKTNGYESIKQFFGYFLKGYEQSKNVYTFLDEFDSLMIKERIKSHELIEYDKKISKVKNLFDRFFEQGQKDQSIKSSIDRDEYYYTVSHMILGICKRLATAGHIVPSDDIVSDLSQIQMALEICTKYIKNESEN